MTFGGTTISKVLTGPRLEDEQGPSREELTDLYKIAVEEYRFQVTLNWDRAKYLLGFNTAVITVGTGFRWRRGSSSTTQR